MADKKEMNFKPGDLVKFPGLQSDLPKASIPAIEGELYLMDHNTSIKGVMMIKGDSHRMMFLPDGTIYCHPKFGVMLKHKEEPNVKEKTSTENKNRETLATQGSGGDGSSKAVRKALRKRRRRGTRVRRKTP